MHIFVRHTFPMSKSSIKTKTVLTMTDMIESTELQAFKRPKDGYKVTVKISLCICVVLSWDELKVRQNLLASDHERYMVCLHVATANWQIWAPVYISSLSYIIRNSSNPSSLKNLDVRPYDRPYKVLLLACAANPISVRQKTQADDNKVRILECRALV